jgi:hypothetical protein
MRRIAEAGLLEYLVPLVRLQARSASARRIAATSREPHKVLVVAGESCDAELSQCRNSISLLALPKATRKSKNCFSPFFLYRDRNAIERMFCIKDFRCIATRYDRLARTSSLPSASPQPSAIGYKARP